MIIGIIANFLHCQSLPISVLKSIYCSIFSCSFSFTVVPCCINCITFLCLLANSYDVWFVVFQFMVGLYREILQYLRTFILKHFFQWVFIQLGSSWKSISCAHHPMNNHTNSIMHLRQYCFCESILYSATKQPFVSSLSPHNLNRDETLCLLCSLYYLFQVLGLVQPLTFPVSFIASVFSQLKVSWLLTSYVFLLSYV